MLGKYSEAERVNAKCEFVCELVRQISKYSCTPKCSTEDGASDFYHVIIMIVQGLMETCLKMHWTGI